VQAVLLFLYIYALGIAALIVLLACYALARWLLVVVAGGVLAVIFMVAEAGWLILLGGQHGAGYALADKFGLGSLVALAIYFPLAVTRHRQLKSRNAGKC